MTDDTKHLPDKLWTVEETASFLNMSEKALRRRIERDQVPYRKVGTSIRFDPVELYRWTEPDKEAS